jgi:flagellar basal body-associated protein FliL
MSDKNATATKKPDAPAGEAPAAPPKRRRLRWIGPVAGLLLLVAGGSAGFYFWRVRAASTAEAPAGETAHAAPAAHGKSSVLTFEPFVVNLADKEGARFLRVHLRLLVEGSEGEHLQKDEVTMLRVRSDILELLSAQLADRLVTPEGKAEVKQAIAARATAILGETKVIDVLFSEFVVQF